MVKNKNVFQKLLCLVIILFLSGYCSLDITSRTMSRQGYDMEGFWENQIRTLVKIPITVSVDENLLIIQSSSLRSNITIRVSQGSEVVYEQTVPAAETENIYINLGHLENGTYRLDLTNQWDDHLYGDFDIQK